jgi:hypothetical protein
MFVAAQLRFPRGLNAKYAVVIDVKGQNGASLEQRLLCKGELLSLGIVAQSTALWLDILQNQQWARKDAEKMEKI